MLDYLFTKSSLGAAYALRFFPPRPWPAAGRAPRLTRRQAGQTRTSPRIMNLPTIAKEENWLLDPPPKPTASP